MASRVPRVPRDVLVLGRRLTLRGQLTRTLTVDAPTPTRPNTRFLGSQVQLGRWEDISHKDAARVMQSTDIYLTPTGPSPTRRQASTVVG